MSFFTARSFVRNGVSLLSAFFVALWLACSSAGAVAYRQKPNVFPTIYTYDMTPVRDYDPSKADQRNNAWAELHAVAALQGLVNRRTAKLYVTFVTNRADSPGNIDQFWLSLMHSGDGWIAHNPLEPVGSLEDLVQKFRSDFQGVVLYDLNVPATSNVASTVAGCDNLLPVAYDTTPGSVYERVVAGGPQLPVKVRLINEDGSSMFTGAQTGSAKCDAYLWAKEQYLDTGKCDPSLLAFYPDYWCLSGGLKHDTVPYERYALTNHDYFIARRAFFFDLSPWADERPQDDPHQPLGVDYRTLRTILQSANKRIERNAELGGDINPPMIHVGGFVPWAWKYTDIAKGSTHGGVAAEWRFAAIISCFNGYMDADALAINAMANASFFSHYPLKTTYPQKLPGLDDWIRKGYLTKSGRVLPWTFVTFYSGDYDSAAWIYQKLPTLWTDPVRGTIPIGWAFNPNLADRFPLGFDWVRRTASTSDYFLAGDSGAGYINPGYLDGNRTFSGLPSGLGRWEAHCAADYKKFDISMTGFIIDGDAPPSSPETLAAYSRFSPDGIVVHKLATPYGLIPNSTTPCIKMEDTLPAPDKDDKAFKIVQRKVDADQGSGPHFHIFRTILWSPSQDAKFYQHIETLGNVVVVDPYTFMAILKMHLVPSKH